LKPDNTYWNVDQPIIISLLSEAFFIFGINKKTLT